MNNRTNGIRLFPPELRTASIVPRWSIVWTLNRDTLANHTFFVTYYAGQIARLINWHGQYGILLIAAIIHDLEETITGDIVSPAKAGILDTDRAAAYISAMMKQRLPVIVEMMDGINQSPMADDVWRIVTAADRLDALLFMVIEKRLGNTIITKQIDSARARLQSAWLELPAPTEELHMLWQTVMLPVIEEHETSGGYGI